MARVAIGAGAGVMSGSTVRKEDPLQWRIIYVALG